MLITNQEELKFAYAWRQDADLRFIAAQEAGSRVLMHRCSREYDDLTEAIVAYMHAYRTAHPWAKWMGDGKLMDEQAALEAYRRAYLKGAQSPHAR